MLKKNLLFFFFFFISTIYAQNKSGTYLESKCPKHQVQKTCNDGFDGCFDYGTGPCCSCDLLSKICVSCDIFSICVGSNCVGGYLISMKVLFLII